MINIEAHINKHTLFLGAYVNTETTLPTGSIDVDAINITQIIGDEWSGRTLTAQFWRIPGEIYEVAVEQNSAVIPAELLAVPGIVHVAIYGTDNNNTRISTNRALFEVEEGSYTEAGASAPTQSMFEKAVEKALDEITITNDKLNNMPGKTLKGNGGSSSAKPQDLTQAQVRALFAFVAASNNREGSAGFVPAGPVGSQNLFFKGNGSFARPDTDVVDVVLDNSISELGYLAAGDSLSKAMTLINLLVDLAFKR